MLITSKENTLAKALWSNATKEEREFIETYRREYFMTVGRCVTLFNNDLEDMEDILDNLREKYLFGAHYINVNEERFDSLVIAHDIIKALEE